MRENRFSQPILGRKVASLINYWPIRTCILHESKDRPHGEFLRLRRNNEEPNKSQKAASRSREGILTESSIVGAASFAKMDVHPGTLR